jgi:zinc protease
MVIPFPRLAGALLAGVALAASAQEVKTLTLSNGMKILVQEDHAIPSVAMYFFFRIGSRNEQPGTTGLSHFFEHMMFNGAKKYGPKQFDIQMEKAGGRNNAYTSTDLTVYTDWFPSDAFELMMDMESDRIRDLVIDPKIVESERGVVYSERRTSVDNNNRGLLDEQLQATAFTAHPYQWPVVGWPSDIEGWTMEDLRAHFRKGYAPNNCTMVIVGDVTLARVTALAKKYLEPIPRQEPPPPVRTVEPEQTGERRLEVHKPAQLPLIMVAYHTPATRHADSAALDVVQALLTEGRTARLYKRLVDQDQLALSAQSNREETFDPHLLAFSIQPRRGVEVAKVETALYEELAKLGAAPVSAEELQKAKNQLLAGHYRGLKTLGQRANALGRYEMFYGGYEKLASVETELNSVTAADVQRVAKQYLTPRNRTVATLVPTQEAAQ